MLSFVLCLSLLGAPEQVATPDAEPVINKVTGLYDIEQAMLDAINAERAAHGLRALKIDKDRQEAARKYCIWMAKSLSLTHSHQGCGENIACGQADVPAVVSRWMGSRGHRANILTNYSHTGVACYVGRDGRLWWIQQFITKADEPTARTP